MSEWIDIVGLEWQPTVIPQLTFYTESRNRFFATINKYYKFLTDSRKCNKK